MLQRLSKATSGGTRRQFDRHAEPVRVRTVSPAESREVSVLTVPNTVTNTGEETRSAPTSERDLPTETELATLGQR